MLHTFQEKIPDLFSMPPWTSRFHHHWVNFRAHLGIKGPCPTNHRTFSRGKKKVSWKSLQKHGHEKAPHRNLWQFFFKSCTFNSDFLRVSTRWKTINWIGSSAQVGVKIKSFWNNHLAHYFSIAASSFCSLYRCAPCCLLPEASVTSHHMFFFGWKNQRHLITS